MTTLSRRAALGLLTTASICMALATSALAGPTEDAIIKKLNAKLGSRSKIDSVVATPYSGLYEVRSGNNIIYTDKDAKYLMLGEIIEVNSRNNLTAQRIEDITKVRFDELPLDLAFKITRGNGKRTVAVFEDPNCGYCKKLEESLSKLNDVTIYMFLYPILSPDSADKSKAIWCSSDRTKAWYDWMLEKKTPTGANCETPIDQIVDYGQRQKISGTPTLFFADGKRVPGVIPIEKIEEMMAQAGPAPMPAGAANTVKK